MDKAAVDGATDTTQVPAKDVLRPDMSATHSSRPEYDTPARRRQYRVWQDGVATVVKRKGRGEWSASALAEMLRFLSRYRLWLPEVVAFTRKTIALSPWRMLLKLGGGFIESLQPLAHVWFHNELLRIAYAAVETRRVDGRRLAFAVIGRVVSSALSDTTSNLLRENDGVLQLLFNSMIEEHMMEARARLDITTQQRPAVVRIFRHVGRMSSTSSYGGQIRDAIDAVNSFATILVQISVLRSLTTRENRSYLALSSLGFLTTLRWLFRSPNRERREETNHHYNQMRILFEASNESSTLQESKLLDLDNFFLKRYKEHAARLGPVSVDLDGPWSRVSRLAVLFESVVDAGLFARYALKECVPGKLINITVPDLQFIRAASRTLVMEFSSLFSLAHSMQYHVTAIREFNELLSLTPSLAEPLAPIPFKTTPGEGASIEFKNVSFHYPNKPPALRDVSFTIAPGQVVALVGDNAAGKSTLIQVLTRLADASSGHVLINGVDVKDYNTHDLHANLSVLFQTTASLNLTIREFIGVDSADKDFSAIEQAAKEAGIHDAIMRLPLGYDSVLGPYPGPSTPESFFRTCLREDWEESHVKHRTALEREADEERRRSLKKAARTARALEQKTSPEAEEEKDVRSEESDGAETPLLGSEEDVEGDSDDEGAYDEPYPAVAFSGGEFQRLATARALLRNAAIKIFDEFSSSLDPLAEREVFRQIWRSRQSSTILYVTHRFASVPFADKILVMLNGALVEHGTHDELVAAGGHYSEMYAAASAGFTENGEDYVDKEPSEGTTAVETDPLTPESKMGGKAEENGLVRQTGLDEQPE